ncbi:MAG TPA: hypothetical protein PLN31_20105 [Azoarcus taiwanensis]|nr:hypothetical protein [Rhodocyclaceae bacterium]HRQ59727.1 hypothetical protein [Azoarcus taiwanensis]
MIRLLKWLLPALALALLSTAAAQERQPLAETVSTEFAVGDREMLEQIAKYLGGRPPIDGLLTELGFDPARHAPVPPEAFAKWPDLRKVEQAYRAALAEGGEEAGQRALRGLARKIADRTDAIRYERSLKTYFPEPPNTPLQADGALVRFSLPATRAITVAVPEGVRAVVMTLARYVSPVPGGFPSLLAGCCALSDAESYRLLSTAATNEDALVEAIRTSRIPPELKEKLARAIRHVAERNQMFMFERVVTDRVGTQFATTAAISDVETDALARDVAEQALRENGLGDAADRQVVATGTAPEAGLGSATAQAKSAATASADNRETFLARVRESRGGGDAVGSMAANARANGPLNGGGGGISFSTLTGRGSRFGGVVFGNTLQRPDNFRVQHVSWSAAGSDASGRRFGRFNFVADDGRVAFGATLPEDIAYAAVAVVIDGIDGILPPIGEGEGVPLAGVDDHIAWPVFDSHAARPSIKLGRSFTVNPALDGLPLGYSAVLTDAIPFMTTDILARLKDTGASEQEVDWARQWLERKPDWGFYKITDAPLELIVLDHGYVDVRSVPPTAQPEALRTSSLLTMVVLPRESEESNAFGTSFYEIVPALVRAYRPFADLNAFAEAFALVRWAKQDGAQLGPRPSTPSRGEPLHFVVVADDTATLVSPAQLLPQLESTLRQADAYSGELANGAVEATAINAKLTELRRQMIVQFAAARHVHATVARSNEERERMNEVAAGLLERAESMLVKANDMLQAALESGAGFIGRDALDTRNALVRQAREQKDALEKLMEDKWSLMSLDARLHNAPASVKAEAQRLIHEIEQRVADGEEIDPLLRRLVEMLPIDHEVVAALDTKIELADAQYMDARKAEQDLIALPEFKRLQDWLEVQQASFTVVDTVIGYLRFESEF